MDNSLAEVVALARQFMNSAILIERDYPWVAGINAAFSVELFMKSYLLEEVWEDDPEGFIDLPLFQKQTRKLKIKNKFKPGMGHDLYEIFKRLPDFVKNKINESVNNNLIKDLPRFLKNYRQIFKEARYPYEGSGGDVLPVSALIHLAKVFDHQVTDVNK